MLLRAGHGEVDLWHGLLPAAEHGRAGGPLAQSHADDAAYRIGGRTTYAMEGSIFVAGAAVKWLRDGIGIIAQAAETANLAASVADDHGVYMVPAFVGFGAPHRQPDARGLICGLTLDVNRAHLVRAALSPWLFRRWISPQRWQAKARGAHRRCASMAVWW